MREAGDGWAEQQLDHCSALKGQLLLLLMMMTTTTTTKLTKALVASTWFEAVDARKQRLPCLADPREAAAWLVSKDVGE